MWNCGTIRPNRISVSTAARLSERPRAQGQTHSVSHLPSTHTMTVCYMYRARGITMGMGMLEKIGRQGLVLRASSRSRRGSVLVRALKTSILVADIGGTNCRFQLWELDAYLRPARMVLEKMYGTHEYDHFDHALQALLDTEEAKRNPPQAAAFACAGPVKNERCAFTNLKWVVDKKEVEEQFGLKCRVLNDFEAIGYGVTVLEGPELLPINDVPIEDKGPIAVLGPGTGLGQAQLFWDDAIGNYKVHASEGSHSTFAPRGWKQRALQARVEAERGHCSVERVACGSGLVRIYDFLHSDEISNRPHVPRMEDPTPAAISKAALDGSDVIASEALDMFLAIVGAEASHMALRGLTTGGVYIAGGILPKVIQRVERGGLLEAFLWKASRFHDKVLKYIPLFVVMEEKVGLIGSREQAIQLVVDQRQSIHIAT